MRAGRPLTTLVFYPAARPTAGHGGGRSGRAKTQRVPAAGRFPLVLFSHGLRSSPERFAAALSSWAAAGFVVAAPTYPHTSEFAPRFDRGDIVRQPDDARHVLREVLRLDVDRRDALSGHIDTERIAALGHSAGGYTTSGLFVAGHDPRLRAGVILAGWAAPGAFAGPPATMLFIQGKADPVVPVKVSRAAYDRVPWPKSYILMRRDSHGTYLRPGDRGYAAMLATTTDFLRGTLG
ncbi:alpha/beta hydrolase family protein [Paractinoplanes deccanensis]|nr:alpha/beta hydrolase [Actinoplanes deccanensis]